MPQTSARVRWRVVLPIVMVVLSAFLTMFAQVQDQIWRAKRIDKGIGRDVPARIIDAAINGPGYAFPIRLPVLAPLESPNRMRYYELQKLIGVGIFWFLLGLAIDRKNKPFFSSRYPSIAAFIFTITAVAWGALGAVAIQEMTRNVEATWMTLTKYPFMSTETIGVAWTLWIFGFFGYFVRKSFVAWNCLYEKRKTGN